MFFELGLLRPGDRVRVTRRDRSIAVFEITGVRRYPKDRFPTQLVYGNTANAALRLITCGESSILDGPLSRQRRRLRLPRRSHAAALVARRRRP